MTESPILRWMHLVVGGQKLVETPVIDVQCCHMWPTVATGKLASSLFGWHKTSLVGLNSSCWYIGKKIRAQDSSIGSLSDPTRNHSQPNSTWLRNQPTVVALAFGFLGNPMTWVATGPFAILCQVDDWFKILFSNHFRKKITDFFGQLYLFRPTKTAPSLRSARGAIWELATEPSTQGHNA